jgi:glycosyltransferase involved in cell wall biosynthesis
MITPNVGTPRISDTDITPEYKGLNRRACSTIHVVANVDVARDSGRGALRAHIDETAAQEIDSSSRSAVGPSVLFLTKYGDRAATTRFRVLQYLPFLREAGLQCEVRPLFSNEYLRVKLDAGGTPVRPAIAGFADRLRVLLTARRYALVVVHMEALPFLPAFFERTLAAMGVPYVYDFDDASFHAYDQSSNPLVRMLSGKIPQIIKGASLVTAGNQYLANYARQFNDRVMVVPTVVDTSRFAPRAAPGYRRPVIIGWIGSPSTAIYVQERLDLWRTVADGVDSRLRLIGSGRTVSTSPSIEVVPWSEQGEAEQISSFDIGIMPLSDDPWSRGKCGFKLIEYMACGLPVVASPVGVNASIVSEGRNGFLCSTDAEWLARLRQLVADQSMRRAMGAVSRELACTQWSVDKWAPILTTTLTELACPRR